MAPRRMTGTRGKKHVGERRWIVGVGISLSLK